FFPHIDLKFILIWFSYRGAIITPAMWTPTGFKPSILAPGRLPWEWALIMPALALLLLALRQPLPVELYPSPWRESVWGAKPVLGYFSLTPSLAGTLRQDLELSPEQFSRIQAIARGEVERLEALELESLVIVNASGLSLEEKRQQILAMGYNARVNEILADSELVLQRELGADGYARLVGWVNARWPVERYLHGGLARPNAARTYRVFATRYDSKGAYTVALPDQCLKFANAGNHLCDEDGYIAGGDYSVYISYESGAAVRVGEAGPWNIDDNYWASLNDPTPRRMFADLGLGMPEAQAAYFNGYNGGKDQFGRTVTAPFGIDLARQVSIDIGLKPGVNDWINVTFMFTDDWGVGGSAPPAANATAGSPAPTREVIEAVQVATPDATGAIIHEVKAGQALWSIAIAYKKTILEIQQLNGLSGNVIVPGQKLVIQAGQGTAAPATNASQSLPAETAATFGAGTPTPATAMPRATRTLTPVTPPGASATPSVTQTPGLAPRQRTERDPVLGIILLIALGGAGSLLYGALTRKRP
ncbi:MAG: LysM peptidoglycan-binding domain-containing protein, partial [Anaerolineales bacterium]|nr:LysM peptidoglycan-binding domain-containing protein [Anaerolineales bacterium]